MDCNLEFCRLPDRPQRPERPEARSLLKQARSVQTGILGGALPHVTLRVFLKGRNMDQEILQAALTGLTFQRDQVDKQIKEIEAQLRGRRGPHRARSASNGVTRANGSRGVMSEEGRARIAAAQRERWVRHKREAKAANRTAGTRKRTSTRRVATAGLAR